MLLPGGLCLDDERRRRFAFKPPTGAIELAMAEGGGAEPMPRRVTSVLSAILEHLGDEVPTLARVHDLCVGDRQFLVRQLGCHMGVAAAWSTSRCTGCGNAFDVFIDSSALPVAEAGEDFPFATADLDPGRCRFRVPTGADQEAITMIDDDDLAARILIRRCFVSLEGADELTAGGLIEDLADEDFEQIETALERVAPEVTIRVETRCPDCGAANQVAADPYDCLTRAGDELFDDVHTLATTYHWSEVQILSLPRERRWRYLRLVDRARGMTA